MKKLTSIFLIFCVFWLNINPVAYAKQNNDVLEVDEETDESSFLDDAICISNDTYISDGKEVTQTVYVKKDGTKIIDTLECDMVSLYSSSGNKTATRTRQIDGWGSVTLTATFDWYTKVPFSYVRCTDASYNFNLNSNVALSQIHLRYTEDYVSIGKANAKVSYFMYNKIYNAQHVDDSFEIRCSDTGVITTN
ncbi:MAG: hypothetical protein NC428_12215 [Clostridium sp.]|nr:hypothetical protein [Clostridium sp.]